MLLDVGGPLRVSGAPKEPLIMPTQGEREGKVPNAVYSRGTCDPVGLTPPAVEDS